MTPLLLLPPSPAAREAAASQHYPQGALYVVATPIGNLADITLRALDVLQLADAWPAKTRATRSLLRAYGIERPASHCWRCTSTTRTKRRRSVVARLQRRALAYVSDAGTPGVSDPGARLGGARAPPARDVPLPGASSITAAMSAGRAPVGEAGAASSSMASCPPRPTSASPPSSGSRRAAAVRCCWRRRTASTPWPALAELGERR